MARRGNGNVRKFQRELNAMADGVFSVLREKATEQALELRDRAEENGRARLGHEPGLPNINDSWWAGVRAPDSDAPTSRATAEAELRAFPDADTLWVGNHAFTSWFHEYGYYRKDGGARPKWMLRDALVAMDGRVERI